MRMLERCTLQRVFGLWLFCSTAFILLHCGDQVAGTSVGTDNPDIVALTFVRDGKPTRMTGRIEVYSDKHNPLVDAQPLAAFEIFEEDTFYLEGDTLLSRLVRSGRVRIGHDTILSFNVLGLDTNGEGAFREGLTFEYYGDSIIASPSGRQDTLELAPLRDYRGSMDVQEKESISNYVAIFGTPYFTLIQNDAFHLKIMAHGRYEIQWIPFNLDGPVSGDSVWLSIYSVNGVLDTDIERMFTAGDVDDTIVVPRRGIRLPE